MLRYVELKTGYQDDGPAWIGRVAFSRTGRTVYFNGKAFKKCRSWDGGNHRDLETGEFYWISGVKKRGRDRHWAGSGKITIEADAVAEYLQLVGRTELDARRFIVCDDIVATDPARFRDLENQPDMLWRRCD